MMARRSAPGSHRPRLALAAQSSRPCSLRRLSRAMLHPMATITVRVNSRASRRGVQRGPGGRLIVRVQAAPENGRANDEAEKTLAHALGVPRSAVSLRAGARSRLKVFEVEGLSSEELAERVQAL